MGKNVDWDRIVATITDQDIDHLLRSTAPAGVKEQVRAAPDQEIKKRFVAGYLDSYPARSRQSG